MTYGVKSLRKLQLFREVTPGTPAAATTVMRVEGVLQDDTSVVFPPEDVGILGGVDRSYVPSVGGSLALSGTPATFEQLPYILEMGVKSVGTGAADGGGTDLIYDYPLPTTSQNTPATYSIEGGDNAQAEIMSYCYCPDFTLSGKYDEAVLLAATIKGRQVGLQAFTGSVAIPTVEQILFNKGKLYIDAVGGTIGSTVKAAVWLGFTLKVTTGMKGQATGDGNLYFSFVKQIKPQLVLTVTMEMDSAVAVAEKAAWRAQTPRQIRMEFLGSAVTPGTVFSNKALRIDLAGKWDKFGPLKEDKGDDTIEGTFQVGYDSTAALFADFKMANTLATLT